VAVSSSRYTDSGIDEIISSPFTNSTFGALYDYVCPSGSTEPACNFDFGDTEQYFDSSDVRIYLEQPANGAKYSGIGSLQGWAVSETPISEVLIFVDGHYFGSAPYGGIRNDVGAAFPDVFLSANSGFSMAINYGSLGEGVHLVDAVAVNISGFSSVSSSSITVESFHSDYFGPNTEVSTTNASVSNQGTDIRLNGFMIDGVGYNVLLRWNTAIQGFSIVDIQ